MEFEPADTPVPAGKLPTRLEPFYDSRARYLFCKAVEEHTPEVLEALRREVLPVYQDLTVEVAKDSYANVGLRPVERIGLDVDPLFKSALPISWWKVEQGASKTAEGHALYGVVKTWSEQFHLTDEWVRDLALQTLFRWRQQADAGEPVLLRWQRLPVGELFGLFDGRGEEFLFRHSGWDLRDEWLDFERSLRRVFEATLHEYHEQTAKAAFGGGWNEAPNIQDELQRFKWLAWYLVREWNATRILKESSWATVTVNNITKQIKASADQAGVSRPSRRQGRPRKSESAT